MNNNRINFVVVFLVVATLVLSSFAVAQQAQRRPPASSTTKIQRDGLKSAGIQWDGSKSSSVKLQEGPLAKPRPSTGKGRPTVAETHGVVLPDFKPVSKKTTPNPSSVAKARANQNAAFKRAGGVKRNWEGAKRIIDPSFKPTETTSIIDPSFKPTTNTVQRNNAVETNGMIDPSFRPNNRATGAVGLESSMKQSPAGIKGTKRVPSIKISPIAKQGVAKKGLIDPTFNPTETNGMIDPSFKPSEQ